ncbi:MAG: PHP domain-containing protein [Bryobacteraceae bacterium]
MIDLHTHTDRSDGSTTPGDLVSQAAEAGLEALAITDHDTLAGYDAALPFAAARLELICAVELSTRPEPRTPGKREGSVHVLGYWLDEPPTAEFRVWLETQQAGRRKRNVDLVAKLNGLGVEITLGEAQMYGRNQVGRPHFARVLVNKGYARDRQQAFDLYLADDAKAAVERDEPTLQEGIARIVQAGGMASLAHPVRLPQRGPELAEFVDRLTGIGLRGIEVVHSEHTPLECQEFAAIARAFNLIATGGTDFHGDNKPGIQLGSGIRGNVCLDYDFLDRMRDMYAAGEKRLSRTI